MPSAFSVAGNPIISAGTLAVTGAGSASEYIRGDGTLANFPNSTGGGASVNYYLNGGTTVATISGVTYYELNKLAAVGTPTNFNVASNDYIASFLTNPTDPNKLLIPAGNWNFALYFSASTNAGSPNFYVELYKYDGTTFTLIADTSASPKDITSGTTKDLYTTIMAVPQTTLTLTDRLAVRVYVNNSGNTITLHTQGDNLCQIVTTFTTGLTALNGLTDQVQFFGVSTASPIGITSAGNTHTLNIPDASQTVRGVVSTGTQIFAGSKTFSSTPTFGTMTPGSVLFAGPSGVLSQDNPNLFWDNTNDRLGIGIAVPTQKLHVSGNIFLSTGSDKFVRIGSSTNYWYDLQCTGDTFQIIDGGGVPRLHIRYPNGNVGIGTTTPGERLDVNGNIRMSSPLSTSALVFETLASNSWRIRTSSPGGIGNVFAFGPTNVITTEQSIIAARRISVTSTVDQVGFNVTSLQTATSGTTDYSSIVITNSVNHSGTYAGVARGFYYNPSSVTYTGTHRAIETVRGDVIFGSMSGNVSIGSTSINPSAQLQMTSITKGFLPPRMTSVQRNAIATPAAGLIVYDVTLNKHYGYNGTTWNAFY
jgi:hypothetical protein